MLAMRIPKFYIKSKHLRRSLRIGFWFSTGAFLAIFFITSFSFLIFEKINQTKVYPGVFVAGKNLGGETKEEIQKYFQKKNELIETNFIFTNSKEEIATVSAKEIDFGYDDRLFATQAFSIGRSKNTLTDTYLILKAYINGIYLSSSYKYTQSKLLKILEPYSTSVEKKPIDALFKFENGKVTTFRASEEGKIVDFESLNNEILSYGEKVLIFNPKIIKITVPIKILKPKVTTESVNSFGIKELIGSGNSRFFHSIPGRIHNISLAALRLNGVMIKPGGVFSFDDALGDVSNFTGYQQAYVIKDGKTVLGDGGGVCQVSTTLFRAILNAGLPIVERQAHAYRVGYYEQDSGPGLDATTYVPSVDLKFKNDTANYILIQTTTDLDNLSLNFSLYGTKDGRTVAISNPVISNQTPPPPPLFQDDPTLPKGEVKQIDFEASGANVYITREVKKNGKVLISEKFTSNYQPWQAVYLKGTQ